MSSPPYARAVSRAPLTSPMPAPVGVDIDAILARLEPLDTALKRPRAAAAILGIGVTTVYLHARTGLLPPRVRISEMAVGWPLFELNAINITRIQGGDVRRMVERLIEIRPRLSMQASAGQGAAQGVAT